LRLAERDGEIRRAVALYLADKVKNGTPMQREIAEKLLKRHPPFYYLIASPPSRSRHRCAFADVELQRRAQSMCTCRTDDNQHQPASSNAGDNQKSQMAPGVGYIRRFSRR